MEKLRLNKTPLQTIEHKPIEFGDEHKEWLNSQNLKQNKEKLLGLHKTIHGIAPGNFIGAVWLGEGDSKTPLVVDSKFQQMDYMSMYLACAEDTTVGSHLENCFYFWPEQPSIEAQDVPKLSELIIAAFLRELNELCIHRLRRHFKKETANLQGKVKGKVLLHLQVKRNLAHGREDRVFCSYETIDDDIPENRVLRAALEQSARFINARRATTPPVLHRWIHASRSALSGVAVVALKRSDFRNLRVRGSFAHYRRAIELAKFVLLRLGANPHTQIRENISTPPFAINSAELFERYAEKILRERYPDLKAGYSKSNTAGDCNGFNFRVRPDFWVPQRAGATAKIIDAKYKEKEEYEESSGPPEPSRDEAFQMVSYSRHQNFLAGKLECKREDEIELILVYPNFEQSEEIEEIKTDNSFFAPIKMRFIKCPVTKTDYQEKAA